MRLISYKMSHDTGFAPNPFFGVLTLATCKPGIRRSSTRRKDDWIAGFGSKSMCGDEAGNERLIFLMEVTEIKPLKDYYENYPQKLPIPPGNSDNNTGVIKNVRRGCGGNSQKMSSSKIDFRRVCGDNIYEPRCLEPQGPDDYRQLNNQYHDTYEQKERDIKGVNALISNKFYYFGGRYEADGRAGFFLPETIQRPNLAPGQSGYGTITEGSEIPLIKYIQDRFKKPGIYGHPYSWPTNDESWKNDENYIQPQRI